MIMIFFLASLLKILRQKTRIRRLGLILIRNWTVCFQKILDSPRFCRTYMTEPILERIRAYRTMRSITVRMRFWKRFRHPFPTGSRKMIWKAWWRRFSAQIQIHRSTKTAGVHRNLPGDRILPAAMTKRRKHRRNALRTAVRRKVRRKTRCGKFLPPT